LSHADKDLPWSTYVPNLMAPASHMPRTRKATKNIHNAMVWGTKSGQLGFCYSGPAVWNSLPSDLHDITDANRSKNRLKSVHFWFTAK